MKNRKLTRLIVAKMNLSQNKIQKSAKNLVCSQSSAVENSIDKKVYERPLMVGKEVHISLSAMNYVH